MSKFVEFCFVDASGIHSKLYVEGEKNQLLKDVELVEKLRPNAPIRLLGRNKDTGEPLCIYRGAEFPWNETVLVVKISFGGKVLFPYITSKYIEVGTSFQLVTPYGISCGVSAEPCKRKTLKEVEAYCKSQNIPCLKKLQDCIFKEVQS